MDFSLEGIRKIWVLIGTLIATLGFDFIPQVVVDLFGPTGTELFFIAVGSVVALWQFIKSRIGESTEPQAYSTGEKSKVAYLLWPFKKAA